MPQPYNYNTAQIDPFGSALKGMQTGMAFNQATEQQAQQKQLFEQGQAKLAQQEQLQAQQVQAKAQMDLKLANLAENYSMDNLNKFVIENPSYMKQFEPLMERISGKEKESTIRDGLQLYAMSISNPKRAVEEAKKRADALRESGDEKQASFFDAMAETAEINPKAFTTALGIGLSSAMGFDKFSESTKNLATAKLTDEQTKIVGQDADTRAVAAGNVSKKIIADAKALKAKNDGFLSPAEKVDYQLKLQKAYAVDGGEDFRRIDLAYENIKGVSQEGGVGALTTVLNFYKMVDPSSTVTANETANATNAPGWSSGARSLYNKAFEAGKMDTVAYKQFLHEATQMRTNAKKKADRTRAKITSQAKSLNLDLKGIFNPETDVKKTGTDLTKKPSWYTK